MANTALTKITTRARQLQKKHPGAKWITLVKKAGAEYRAGKLGSARHKKRRAAPAHKKVVHRRKRSVSAVASHRHHTATLTGVTAGSLRSELKKRLKGKIDKAVVNKFHATKKRLKNKYQRTITETKAELRRLS